MLLFRDDISGISSLYLVAEYPFLLKFEIPRNVTVFIYAFELNVKEIRLLFFSHVEVYFFRLLFNYIGLDVPTTVLSYGL